MPDPMSIIPLILASLSPGAAAAGTQPTQPIRLEVQEDVDRITLKVVGQSPTPVEARYRLAVASGGNRSSQGGRVQLVPGQEVTVIRLSVGPAGKQWHAVLDVERDGAPSYSIERGSE